MAHPDGVGKGTEGAVGFGLVQGAEVGVALAVGFEEVRFDKELDPPLPGGVGFAVCLAGDTLDSVCSCTQYERKEEIFAGSGDTLKLLGT